MLGKYFQKYKELIIQRAKDNLPEDLKSKLFGEGVDYIKFLANGDISALINALCFAKVEDDSLKKVKEKIKEEINIYTGETEKINVFNKGKFIAGTKIRLTNIDYNPYNILDAHPDHQATGGSLGWGEKSPQEWLDSYEKTFELLKIVDEGFYDELNTIINKIIPLGTGLNVHNSASYKESIGHLYMGYTLGVKQPELCNIEAIIHESSHNKLNILFYFDDIILNDLSENYYSPFRPDARHLKGVFLAIHAFVPTIYVLMKAFKKGLVQEGYWEEKIILYYIKNKITWKVLKKYAKFTQLGEEIMVEISEVMKLTDGVFKSLNIDKNVIQSVMKEQKSHFHNVNINYPNLKY